LLEGLGLSGPAFIEGRHGGRPCISENLNQALADGDCLRGMWFAVV